MKAAVEHFAAHPGLVKMAFVDLFEIGPAVTESMSRTLGRLSTLLRESSPEPVRAPLLAHETIVGGVWAVIGSYAVRKRVKYLPSLIDHLAFMVLAPYVGPKLAAQTIDTMRRRLLRRSARLSAGAAPAATSILRCMSAIGSRVPPRRVGHKGAAHLAPGNTFASFEAAVRAGVDMIEFDVLSERPDGSGRLLLAHDYHALAAAGASALTLEEGLRAPRERRLRRDRARRRREAARLRRARRARAARDRAARARTGEQHLRGGARRDARARAGAARRLVGAARASRLHREPADGRRPRSRCSPATAPGCRAAPAPRCARGASTRSWPTGAWSPRALVRAVADGGGELYVWTVDDAAQIARLAALGVDGIITNDPRLFPS